MRNLILVFTVIVLLAPVVTSAQSIEGVWRLAEHEGDAGTSAQPVGLMILSDGYYSRAFVRSENPRPAIPDSATSEQQFESWQPFVSNSGTYSLDGSTLTLRLEVAKVVGAMNTSSTAEVRFEDDSVWITGNLEGEDSRQRWVRVN